MKSMLRIQKWRKQTLKMLEAIEQHLLYGDIEEIALLTDTL